MWRLRALSRHLSISIRSESGATMVFIVVVLVGLLAMTAFVIDFGRIWQERRELQVGATAGALAIAEDCARGMCDAAYDEFNTGELYADANATDGAASALYIELDLTNQTVHVVTATENITGGDTLDMLFARIVGFDGITVGAEATVAWGAPFQLATLPIIISDCEWMHPNLPDENPEDWLGWPGGSPDGLPYLADLDPTSPPIPPIVTILFHDGQTTEDCNAVAGQDADLDGKLSGGFGWLDTDGNCIAQVYDGWVGEDPGSSPSSGCGPDELKDLLFGEPVLIPYFDDADGVGAGGEYHIAAYGAFVVAGYNFGGQYKEYNPDYLSELPCDGDERCVAGWFVQTVQHGGDIGGIGGENRGVIVIKLTG
jgi:hypothetical protein